MLTDIRTNRWKTGSLYRAMPEAGATKNQQICLPLHYFHDPEVYSRALGLCEQCHSANETIK